MGGESHLMFSFSGCGSSLFSFYSFSVRFFFSLFPFSLHPFIFLFSSFTLSIHSFLFLFSCTLFPFTLSVHSFLSLFPFTLSFFLSLFQFTLPFSFSFHSFSSHYLHPFVFCCGWNSGPSFQTKNINIATFNVTTLSTINHQTYSICC